MCVCSPTSFRGKGLMIRCLTWVSSLTNKSCSGSCRPVCSRLNLNVYGAMRLWAEWRHREGGDVSWMVQLIENSHHGGRRPPDASSCISCSDFPCMQRHFQAAGTQCYINSRTAERHMLRLCCSLPPFNINLCDDRL